MDRGVANTFNGPPVPYYHNNYNHNHHHHHHVAAVGYHHFGPNDNRDQRFNQQHYDHYSGHQNMMGDHNGPFYGGGYGPHGGVRKRRSEFPTGVSPDPTDSSGNAKLYVAPVPRTACEEEVRKVFREYGNVIEIILPRDKRTGERTGYCFVKYKTIVEGDRAIAALQDQYTFPGEVAPVKVRYADGERERIVQIPDKLYVGCLSKQTTKPEIHEVFSSYGVIEDIYMALDAQKQSRGYAFVQFSRREMALAAIQGLNGVFTMRGSDQPLIVRFADPKKPRLGEPRSTPTAVPAMPQCDPHWHPPVYPQWGNREPGDPRLAQQHDFSSQWSHIQQQSAQAVSEVHKQTHQDSSSQNSELHPKPEAVGIEIRGDAQIVASNSSEDPKTSSGECDWSEHTCPDGYKYYYNCVTSESTWEKPQEYAVFEKWLQEQTELQDPKLQSPPSNCQSQEAITNGEEQIDAHLSRQSTGLEQTDALLSQQSVGAEQTDVLLSQQSVGPEQTDAHPSQQSVGPQQSDSHLSQQSTGPEHTDAHLSQQSVGPEQSDAHLSQQSAGLEQIDPHLPPQSVGVDQTDAHLSPQSVGVDQTDAHLLQHSVGPEPSVAHLSQQSLNPTDAYLSEESTGLGQTDVHLSQQNTAPEQTDAHLPQQSVGLEQNDAHLPQDGCGTEQTDAHFSQESTEPQQTDARQQSVGLPQTDAHLSQESTGLQQPSMSTPENNLEQQVTSLAVGATCS